MLKLISTILLVSLTVATPDAAPPNVDAGCDGVAAGQIRCHGASQFYVCSGGAPGVHAILQDVAAGTQCVDGKITAVGAPPPVASPGKPADPTPPLRSLYEQQNEIEKNLADLKAKLKELKMCKDTPYDSVKATCSCIDNAGPDLLRNEKMCNDAKPANTKPPPPPPKYDDEESFKDKLKKSKQCQFCGPASQCIATCECLDKAVFDDLQKDMKMCDKAPIPKKSNPNPSHVDSTPFDAAPRLRRGLSLDPNPASNQPVKWDPMAMVLSAWSKGHELTTLKTALKKSKQCQWCDPYSQCKATCDCIDKADDALKKDLKMCDKAPNPHSWDRTSGDIDSEALKQKPAAPKLRRDMTFDHNPPPPRPTKWDPAALVAPELERQENLAKLKTALKKSKQCQWCGPNAWSQCRATCDCIDKASYELVKDRAACDKAPLPPKPTPFIDSTSPSPKPPPDTNPNNPKLLAVKKRLLEKNSCKQCVDRACRARCNCIATAGPELIGVETACDRAELVI